MKGFIFSEYRVFLTFSKDIAFNSHKRHEVFFNWIPNMFAAGMFASELGDDISDTDKKIFINGCTCDE